MRAVLIFLNCVYSFAQSDLNDLKQKKKNTEKQMEDIKDQINDLKKQ